MDIAVNAGNAMYYLPLLPLMAQRTKLSAEMQRDVYEVYVQEMINLSMGQAMDIAWHRGIANADALGRRRLLADVRLQNRHTRTYGSKNGGGSCRRRQPNLWKSSVALQKASVLPSRCKTTSWI